MSAYKDLNLHLQDRRIKINAPIQEKLQIAMLSLDQMRNLEPAVFQFKLPEPEHLLDGSLLERMVSASKNLYKTTNERSDISADLVDELTFFSSDFIEKPGMYSSATGYKQFADTVPKRISAAQIHAEIYAGADEELVEVTPFDDQEPTVSERVATLLRMGFSEQPDVKAFTESKENFDRKKKQHEFQRANYERALKYAMRYPNYKFISWNTLQSVASKYDLKVNGVEKFKGTIPDANVAEMAKFLDTVTLHKEDEVVSYNFMIAAPATEFIDERPSIPRWLLDDPIVLKPVNDGFLIVTVWGDEASDPDVVNERNN